jgi:hypothetical protein
MNTNPAECHGHRRRRRLGPLQTLPPLRTLAFASPAIDAMPRNCVACALMVLRKAMASVSVAHASKSSVYIAHALPKADLVSVALHFNVL